MSFRSLRRWIFPDSSCLCSGNELRYLCQYSWMQNLEKQRIFRRNIRIPTGPLEASNGEFLDQRKFLRIRYDSKYVSMISGLYTLFNSLAMWKYFFVLYFLSDNKIFCQTYCLRSVIGKRLPTSTRLLPIKQKNLYRT